MLSRVAEPLFVIGRYIERSDATARILDVHLQLQSDDPWIDDDATWRSLLAAIDTEPPRGKILTRQDVLGILAVDRSHPASIAYALGAARENAGRARGVVSSELWECLNATRARMPRRVADDKVHEFVHWVHERAALAVGIVESATSRDDAWHLFTLGRSIERADMTARLLGTLSLTESSRPSWTTILRSCGAYEAYLRTYRGSASEHNAAEFVLLDRLFPRSILFSVSRAEECMRALDPRFNRVGVFDSAQRQCSQVRSDLEGRPIGDVLENLPAHLTGVRDAATAVNEAITLRYFSTSAAGA